MRTKDGRVEMGDIVKYRGRVFVAEPWPHGRFIVVASTNGYCGARVKLSDCKVATRKEAVAVGIDPDAPRP